jgi:hypothetical protein
MAAQNAQKRFGILCETLSSQNLQARLPVLPRLRTGDDCHQSAPGHFGRRTEAPRRMEIGSMVRCSQSQRARPRRQLMREATKPRRPATILPRETPTRMANAGYGRHVPRSMKSGFELPGNEPGRRSLCPGGGACNWHADRKGPTAMTTDQTSREQDAIAEQIGILLFSYGRARVSLGRRRCCLVG